MGPERFLRLLDPTRVARLADGLQRLVAVARVVLAAHLEDLEALFVLADAEEVDERAEVVGVEAGLFREVLVPPFDALK